jgi:hypothetical protein
MKMNVIHNIDAGKYDNKTPIDAKLQSFDKYLAEESRLRSFLKGDLEEEHGLQNHPKRDRLFEIAWKYGSPDYKKVVSYYADLAELLKP